MAEEGLGDCLEARFLAEELVHDLFHLREHFGASEFGDDEVVGEERVPEWARGGVVRVRV